MPESAKGTRVALFASEPGHPLADWLRAHGFVTLRVRSATETEAAVRGEPDIIILDAVLRDLSGIEACRRLRAGTTLGINIPILLLTPAYPTPEERVSALTAGAWDIASFNGPADLDALGLRIETFVQAKRNVDAALADGLPGWPNVVLNRTGFARRAREMGSLLVRQNGSLACLVIAAGAEPGDPRTGHVVARSARVSDIVADLGASEYAILAPATDEAGVVRLAQRVATALSEDAGEPARGSSLKAGYATVGNLRYEPLDPIDLWRHASAAVHSGTPERAAPWVRRYSMSPPSGSERAGR